jgi:hypothetical protein
MRLIRLEVRTKSIAAWTKLSTERIKHFIREYALDSNGRRPRRHNGPVLKAVKSFLDPALASEAAIIAAYCVMEEIIPPGRWPLARRELPCVERGERLFRAYRRYHRVVHQPRFSAERVMALVIALAEGEEIAYTHCTAVDGCPAGVLIDPHDLAPPLCPRCKRQAREASRSCRVRPTRPASGTPMAGMRRVVKKID